MTPKNSLFSLLIAIIFMLTSCGETIDDSIAITIDTPSDSTYFETSSGLKFKLEGIVEGDFTNFSSFDISVSFNGKVFSKKPKRKGAFSIPISGLSDGVYDVICELSDGENTVFSNQVTFYIGKPNPVVLTEIEDAFTNKLSWTKSNISNFKQYEVYRSISPYPFFGGDLISTITDINTTNFSDNDIAEVHREYYYQVAVRNKDEAVTESNNLAFLLGYQIELGTEKVVKMIGDPKRDYIYCLLENSKELAFYNTNTFEIDNVIPFANELSDLDIGHTGDLLYVVENASIIDAIKIVDLNTQNIISTVTTLNRPLKVEVFEDYLFYTVDGGSGSGKLYRVDLATNASNYVFSLGSFDIESIPNSDYLFLADRSSNSNFCRYNRKTYNLEHLGDYGYTRKDMYITDDGNYISWSQNLFSKSNTHIRALSEEIYDFSSDGSKGIGWRNIISIPDGAKIKEIPTYIKKAVFTRDDQFLIIYYESASEDENKIILYPII